MADLLHPADSVPTSESSHTPADSLNAHISTASQMASNAKDSALSAAATARDTVAKHGQATIDDVQGLSHSAQQAFHDSNGHPLAKYHSFVYDTLTWKFPRASGIAFFLIVSGLLASQFVHFSRFVFRILWLSFATIATVEAISKLVTGSGLISGLKPRQYYQVNKLTFDVLFLEVSNLMNFIVLEFQRLLFAENTAHTAIAFVISFLAYKLVKFIPLWALALTGTIFAFSIPPLYLHNQELIDHHVSNAQNLAAEKVKYAQDLAGHHVNAASEKAKVVTSEWGRKAGVELPWSPKSGAKSSGVEKLQGLNVPQTTPQKRSVDPATVPVPETPGPAAPVAL